MPDTCLDTGERRDLDGTRGVMASQPWVGRNTESFALPELWAFRRSVTTDWTPKSVTNSKRLREGEITRVACQAQHWPVSFHFGKILEMI